MFTQLSYSVVRLLVEVEGKSGDFFQPAGIENLNSQTLSTYSRLVSICVFRIRHIKWEV